MPPKLHIQTYDPETADQSLEEQPFCDLYQMPKQGPSMK